MTTRRSAATVDSPLPNANPAIARSIFANREQSWMAFNRRVLDQARHVSTPLLERVKFLAIASSNMDEFFEIRVAGLAQQADAKAPVEPSLDGSQIQDQVDYVYNEAREFATEQYDCWRNDLMPQLKQEGIVFMTVSELDDVDRQWLQNYFTAQVLPVLTPLAVDQSHPFPWIGNKNLNVVLLLKEEGAPSAPTILTILPVPRVLPRIVRIASGNQSTQRYVFLTEIIRSYSGALFAGYEVIGTHAFRVTRNGDLYIDEEESENLLKKIEHELRNLRRGAAVRLEVSEDIPPEQLRSLCQQLHLSPQQVFLLPRPLNLARLMTLYDLVDRPDLKYPPFHPVEFPSLQAPHSIFAAIREHDVLLHHPFDSYAPVVEFIQQAACDPDVYAIKQTLYRTSGDSPFIRALIQAAIAGKQVTALVELKARFDEANNIRWARELEEAGVHVVYGVVGRKTHCKCCLVVRHEGDQLRRYAHFGSGNYNPKTARLYTDISFLTCRPHLTADVANLFNALTGLGRTPEFPHLLVAPYNLHQRVQELILREKANALAGKPARIIAKMNKLVDPATIQNLYAASAAGVKIDLIVRATCCLRAGVPGLSENIRLRSIVGRFLEHARIIYCENGGDPQVFCGSADWMPRNFFRRVEALFPIEDPALKRRIIDEILASELNDNDEARILQPDDTFSIPHRASHEPTFRSQRHFMKIATQRAPSILPESRRHAHPV